MDNRVQIFDTTLRDGEQSPGIALNIQEKLEIAEQLARLGVDSIEAGFPITSPGDFEAVSAIARSIRGPRIVGLARTADADIDRAYEAVKHAARPCIHTFVSTSPQHLKHQLHKTEQQVLQMTERAVRRAKALLPEVEFSAMDATRSDPRFLHKVYALAIECGATVLNVPDTVGYTLPDEFKRLIGGILERVPGAREVVLSVHCHNDLGLAVANSLAAVEAGARQVEGAINGIGERAGNASIEELIMILDTRRDLLGLTTSINLREIAKTSRLVSRLTSYAVQPNKAVVGANAFSHESGIHQDGVLKERSTYEIMRPERIGLEGQDGIFIGKHSGRHAFRAKLEQLGLGLNDEQLERAFAKFKELADKKKAITGMDLEALALDEIGTIPDQFTLEHIQSSSGTGSIPIAAVRLLKEGRSYEATARGDGQIDAVCGAIRKAARFSGRLVSYQVSAVTSGIDAQGEVMVKLELHGRQVAGRASGTDVIEASARAYLNAINRLAGLKA